VKVLLWFVVQSLFVIYTVGDYLVQIDKTKKTA